MRQITFDLYDFRELSEAAKTRAINDAREEAAEAELSCLHDDFSTTLQGISLALGIEVRDYNVGGSQPPYFRFDVYGKLNEEDPAFFMRWINGVLSRVEKCKFYYLGGIRRASKIMKTINDWPFSCMGLDERPATIFSHYADYIRAGRTIRDFCSDILNSLADAYSSAVEYAYSDEAIEDFIENNNFSFTENGERFACAV